MFSRFIYIVMCQSFLLKDKQYSIVCIYTTFCLFIHPSMDTWVASVFLTTVVNAARNMAYKYTFDSLLLILLGIYPEMKLLDHIVILYLIF